MQAVTGGHGNEHGLGRRFPDALLAAFIAAVNLVFHVFDKRVQKAIKTMVTDEPELDYHVHHVVKRGFARGGRALRAEEVVVYRYQGEQSSRSDRDGTEQTAEADTSDVGDGE